MKRKKKFNLNLILIAYEIISQILILLFAFFFAPVIFVEVTLTCCTWWSPAWTGGRSRPLSAISSPRNGAKLAIIIDHVNYLGDSVVWRFEFCFFLASGGHCYLKTLQKIAMR
jgi:hypothetical protein